MTHTRAVFFEHLEHASRCQSAWREFDATLTRAEAVQKIAEPRFIGPDCGSWIRERLSSAELPKAPANPGEPAPAAKPLDMCQRPGGLTLSMTNPRQPRRHRSNEVSAAIV